MGKIRSFILHHHHFSRLAMCVLWNVCVSIFVNYVRQVSLYLWCLELKCLSLIFVSVRLSEWHLPVVYLFNVSYFLGPNVSPMPSETNQYESSHDDVDDEGCVCIVGCHHLCALINSRHFAINKKKNPKELISWCTAGVYLIPLRMVNQNWCPQIRVMGKCQCRFLFLSLFELIGLVSFSLVVRMRVCGFLLVSFSSILPIPFNWFSMLNRGKKMTKHWTNKMINWIRVALQRHLQVISIIDSLKTNFSTIKNKQKSITRTRTHSV